MRKLLTAGALAAASIGFAAAPSTAATQQRGLVNVNLEDVVVQVPVGLAANICDVDVNVLANLLADGPTSCDSTADPSATTVSPRPGSSPKQEGLVNVNVSDVVVQVPVAVAANICDVDVAVLSGALLSGPTTCSALAESTATA